MPRRRNRYFRFLVALAYTEEGRERDEGNFIKFYKLSHDSVDRDSNAV